MKERERQKGLHERVLSKIQTTGEIWLSHVVCPDMSHLRLANIIYLGYFALAISLLYGNIIYRKKTIKLHILKLITCNKTHTTALSILYNTNVIRKGKPIVRWGRKAKGSALADSQLPKNLSLRQLLFWMSSKNTIKNTKLLRVFINLLILLNLLGFVATILIAQSGGYSQNIVENLRR